jgi:hypothetical protein
MGKISAQHGTVTYLSDIQTKAISVLFQRQYWGRIWIFQEILLAKRLLVSCGETSLDWEQVIGFEKKLIAAASDRVLKAPARREMFGNNALRLIRNKASLTEARSETEAQLFMRFLFTTRLMEATDRKDKVYGLLGLSERLAIHTKAFDLDVNYSQSAVEIFTEVLRCCKGSIECQPELYLVARDLKYSLELATEEAVTAFKQVITISPRDESVLEKVLDADKHDEAESVLWESRLGEEHIDLSGKDDNTETIGGLWRPKDSAGDTPPRGYTYDGLRHWRREGQLEDLSRRYPRSLTRRKFFPPEQSGTKIGWRLVFHYFCAILAIF